MEQVRQALAGDDGDRLQQALDDLNRQTQPLAVARGAQVWDTASGRLLLTLPVEGQALQVAFSPDGLRLAAADDRGTLTLWDAPP